MSPSISNKTRASINRLIAHIRQPLYRNGYALVASSISTSVLGMVYWILAARIYTTEVIGINSAVISTMIFLANLSQLNLRNALNRFIPSAGRATKKFVLYTYLISLIMAFATSLIFLFGVERWSPTLSFISANPFLAGWFVFATMAWCLFVLQDSVLIGLREAIWVPIENLFFALAKMALLIALFALLPQYGVFASWTIPVMLLLLPINLLIFLRLIPKQVAATKERFSKARLVPRDIAHYVAGDYFGSLIWMGTTNLLPLFVLERAGASANAFYYLSWTMAYSLYLVSRNMGMSLIAEAAANEDKLGHYSYRIFMQTARLLLPVVLIIVIAAPYLLRLFGQTYATEATNLLRLLALSALPNIVTSLHVDIARVRRHMIKLVSILSSLCLLVLLFTHLFLERYGVTAVGMAWLFSQSIIAFFLLLIHWRGRWLAYLNPQPLLRLLAIPRKRWAQIRHQQKVKQASLWLPYILPMISSRLDRTGASDSASATSWQIQKLIPTVSDVTVMTLGPKGEAAVALLKVPQSEDAVISLQQQCAVLAWLKADLRLGAWRRLVPNVLAQASETQPFYVVEQMLPGIEARSLFDDPVVRKRILQSATSSMNKLYHKTARSVVVDGQMLTRWIDEPLLLIQGLPFRCHACVAKNQALIEQLASELDQALVGRTVAVSWIHGDFAPRNILVTPDGATVTGLVDWDQAAPNELPQIDLVQLLLSTRMLVQKRELGDIIRELLKGDSWTAEEQALLDRLQSSLPGDTLDNRTLILLCWLRHISATLTKSTRYRRHWLWISKNVERVLRSL